MDTKNTKNKKKSFNPIGLIVLITVILANVGEIGAGGSAVFIGLIIIAALIAGGIFLSKRLKGKADAGSRFGSSSVGERPAGAGSTLMRERAGAGRGSSALHSHDRASGYVSGSCTPEEHWKRQLDGFLANGIIDRAEYRLLIKRRTGRDI